MKFTILGFNQKNAIKYGLQVKDLLILRWFVDYQSSGRMKKRIINNSEFYWVDYSGIIDSLPILNTQKKDTIYRILKNMSSLEILEHKTIKEGGTWSYFRLGKNYINLIDDNSVPIGKESDAIGKESDPNGLKSRMKNKSININLNNIYSHIISKLNESANKNYKSTTTKTKSLIDARLNEGFTEEDFYQVIENKVNAWKGTDREMYLRPETLFGNKFEGYLNERPRIKKNKTSVREDKEFYPEIQFENLEE